jgi:DNA-binding NtrC family response regulator
MIDPHNIPCSQSRNRGKTPFTTPGSFVRNNRKSTTLKKPLHHHPDEKAVRKMKRILTIDGNAAIRMLYEVELSDEGYDVISSDGEKGLLQLIAAEKPDLILLQANLRSRRGQDLLQDIRSAFQEIPVIVASAYPYSPFDPKSIGVAAYVTKSSDLTGLKQQIKKCLAPPCLHKEMEVVPGRIGAAEQLGFDFNK